ncbi:MAG: hypothetical protein JXA67_06120, partial [Micromonosporaceae bacterium]|nr:hypothetical protein [Micromonosporaceae bacterium]
MILGIWATYRRLPTRMFEQLAVPAEGLPARLCTVAAVPGVREAFILSTCNRVEVYVALDGAEADTTVSAVTAAVIRILTAQAGGQDLFSIATGDEVTRH